MKSSVVELVKRNIKGAITLAIGDGANDVSMISMADVGVGLYGEEGSQAAMAADYAMGEFKFLRKMLLFHGRINYIRIAEMILYFFYKNFLFTIPQFFYAFSCGFSGQTLYDDWYVSLFNLIFTSLPLLFKALIEQDITTSDEKEDKFISSNISKTYYRGRESLIFNIFSFIGEILYSLIGAIVTYFFNYRIMYYTIPLHSTGEIADLWCISSTQFTTIIFMVNFKLLVSQRYQTKINFLIIIFTSYLSYFAYFFASAKFEFSKSQATNYHLIKYIHFYLNILFVSGVFFLVELGLYYIRLNWFDNPINLIKKYTNVYKALKKENRDDLKNVYQEKINTYDNVMRNKYKIQRIQHL